MQRRKQWGKEIPSPKRDDLNHLLLFKNKWIPSLFPFSPSETASQMLYQKVSRSGPVYCEGVAKNGSRGSNGFI